MSDIKSFNPSRMLRDERGNVAISFGLMAIPMFAMIGGAVDFGRAITVHSELQAALDAAALAAIRDYRKNADVQQAEQRFTTYFSASMAERDIAMSGEEGTAPGQATVTVSNTSINTANSSIAPTVSAQLPTFALNLIGIEEITVHAASRAAAASANVQGTKALELSMMLDISGSMSGTKVEDMKDAAQDFLDIVMPADLEADNRRVGLVPFAGKVNAGQFVAAATGLAPTRQVQTGTTNVYTFSTSSFSWRTKSQCGDRVQEMTAYSSYSQSQAEAYCVANFQTRVQNGQTQYRTPAKVTSQQATYATHYLRKCVTERAGTEAYSDAAPADGSYVGSASPTSGIDSQYTADGACIINNTVQSPIMALTTDKVALQSHIESMQITSGTAGHVGTAWAYYMLSPLWNAFWGTAGVDPVVDYHPEDTVKAAVLMTDGAYNSNYNASADHQARQICEAMKTNGITVYTIGFDMDAEPETSRQLLRDCASPGKYYFPYNGTQLRQAFQEIGNSLVTIVTRSADDTGVILTD